MSSQVEAAVQAAAAGAAGAGAAGQLRALRHGSSLPTPHCMSVGSMGARR